MRQVGKLFFSERAFEAAARHRELPPPDVTVRWLERHDGGPPVRLVESPAFPIVVDPFEQVLTPQRAMVEHMRRQLAEGVLMRQPGRLTGQYPTEGGTS